MNIVKLNIIVISIEKTRLDSLTQQDPGIYKVKKISWFFLNENKLIYFAMVSPSKAEGKVYIHKRNSVSCI